MNSKTNAGETPDDAVAHCRRMIELGDEDLFLSLRYALDADRSRLAAIFAFQIEVRRIPGLVSEAPLGEIRLQWWREALDEIAAGKNSRAHPVVEALSATGAVDRNSHEMLERQIDARARLFYEPGFAACGDLESFLRNAEAPLVTLALGGEADMPATTAEALGAAYALARFAPAFAPPLAADARMRARQLFNEVLISLNALTPAAAGRVAFLALTRGHAARADGRPWPLEKRLAIFSAMLTGKF